MATLGYLPPLGGGLADLAATGQHTRLLEWYFPAYLERFERIIVFSHLCESLSDYSCDKRLLKQVKLLPKRWLKISSKIYSLLLAPVYMKELRVCDVLRVSQATGVFPAVIAKRLLGIPFVTTFGYHYAIWARRYGSARWKVALYEWLEMLALTQADAVIVTTSDLERDVRTRNPRMPIWLIPNGVDPVQFAPRTAPHSMRAQKVITSVGRLEAQKNLEIVVQAVGVLRARGIDSRLRLVGEGTLRDRLERLGREQQVPIEFLGVVPHVHLPKVLQESDIFVLASHTEGHPKVLIEAMSCGLPCVASDREWAYSLVRHGENGLLANPEDVFDLANQMDCLCRDSGWAAQLGTNARQEVLLHYDIHRLLAQETERLFTLSVSPKS